MANSPNRRQISGNRVGVACNLELPKIDPFKPLKTIRDGFLVLNVRGCSLYLPHQFTESSIKTLFPDSKPQLLKNIKLYPANEDPILVGDIQVRFLKFNDVTPAPGMVLRFVNLSEKHMDQLNDLTMQLPTFSGPEQDIVPWDALNLLEQKR